MGSEPHLSPIPGVLPLPWPGDRCSGERSWKELRAWGWYPAEVSIGQPVTLTCAGQPVTSELCFQDNLGPPR